MQRWCRGGLVLGLLVACNNEGSFSARQGNDTWSQAPNNEVDILFVVDNSGSMAEEQAALGLGFSSFVGQLEATGTQFHIGVVTTSFDYADPDRGVLVGEPAYLTNADADYVDLFNERVRVGIDGEDKEKGIESASYALSPVMTTTGPNAGFLRTSAQLLVVFVSDEEDCSDGGALEGQDADQCYLQPDRLTPVSELAVELRGMKADPEMVQVGAIVGLQSSTCQNVYPGLRYTELASLTGGLIGDICESDWSEIMSDLGLQSTGVNSSFQLTNGAVPETLEVYVDDTLIEQGGNGYAYNAATWRIRFAPNAVPARGSVITATYEIDPGAVNPN